LIATGQPIFPDAAGKLIGTGLPEEGVLPPVTREGIGPNGSQKLIITGPATQVIGAYPTGDPVRLTTSGQEIPSATALEPVLATFAMKGIGALPPLKSVIASATGQHIPAAATGQGV
jgi:hypothetical protein